MTSLDRAATERANRWALVAGLVMLAGAGEFGWYARQLASWRAVAFTALVLLTLLEILSATVLFWLATSVGKERP